MIRKSAWVIAFAAVLPTGVALADCGPMSLESVPGTRQVTVSDLDGSGGLTLGDKRSGYRDIRATDNDRTGVAHWVNTIRSVNADGTPDALEVELLLVFDDGVLFVTKVHRGSVEDYRQPAATTVPEDAVWIIHNGSGVFASASGTVKISFDAAGESAYVIDMVCE